jgi:hypothetical protein
LLCNIEFQKNNLDKYVAAHNPNVHHRHKRSLMLTAVPEEHWPELTALINMYEQTVADFCIVNWFVTRVLTTSIDIHVAREAVPECYWKYLHGVEFKGENSIKELYDPKCYAILEQVQINNLLLGISGK